MSQVTKPMMLDETGQAIVTALEGLTDAVQPTNVCVDLPVSIPANGWTNSAPYTYTYTHSKITAECGVTVEFESGASNTDCLAMDYEKVAGGVMFTVKTKPSSAVPVIIHVLNAEAEGITSVSADMVSTSAISGSSNVEQALGALNSKLNTNSGVITVQRTTGNTNSFYKYSKIGNVVTVYIEHHASDATINAWTSLDFPGIPSGFRPIQDIVVPASTDRTGSSGMIFSVFPSGVVRLNCKYNAMNDSSDIVRSTVSYAVSF